jgi:hypothetical protein
LTTKATAQRHQIRTKFAGIASDPACAWPARRQFSNDIYRAKGVILGARQVGFGTRAFCETPIGQWWQDRARKDNVLGRWMMRTQAEVEVKFSDINRSAALTGPRVAANQEREVLQRLLVELEQVRRHQHAEFDAKLAAVARLQGARQISLKASRVRAAATNLQMVTTEPVVPTSAQPLVVQARQADAEFDMVR